MRKTPFLWGLAVLLFTPGLALADPNMGGVLYQYKAAAAQFSGTVATAASVLAFSLFLIDSLLTYFKKLANGAEWPEMVFTLAFKMLLLGIIVFLLNPNNVFKPIMDSFQLIGQRGSGLGGIEPTDLFFQGIDLVKQMWHSFAANNPGVTISGSAIAKTVMVGVLMALVSMVIIISYAILAMSVVAIFVEMYFYLAVSPLLVSFGAIRFTRDFISKAVTTSIVIGFRFLGIYFVCKVASVLAAQMAPKMAFVTVDNLDPIWLVVGTSMLLGFLALKIPTMVSNIVNGTSSLGASDVVGAGVAAAAGVAAGGAAGIGALASAAGAGAGGASAAGGAVGAGGASAAGSSAAGVSGLGGIGGGASGASGGGAGASASAASASPPPPTPPSAGAGGQAGGGSTPKELSPPSQPGGSASGPTATQRIADAVHHVEQQTDAPPAQPGSINPGHEE